MMHLPNSSQTRHQLFSQDDGHFSWLQIPAESAIPNPWRPAPGFGSDERDWGSNHAKLAYGRDDNTAESRIPYPLPSSPVPTHTDPPTTDTSAPSAPLQRKTKRYLPAWAVALLALGTTAITIWYSYRVMVDINELPRALQLSPGLTVLVVNVLSHIVAFLALSLSNDVLEHLRWALACRPNGILLTSFLAMSRATPITGVLYLFTVRGWHQLWALHRLLSYLITFGISLILIVNVTFKTVYTPYTGENLVSTHSVVGGLVPLGTSGFESLDLPLVPLIAASYSVAFITDPRFVTKVAPIHCSTSDPNCISLLLPGGMELVRLYDKGPGEGHGFSQSLFSGNFSGDYDTILVNDAPSYQLEYDSIEAVDPSFRWNRSADCNMYGQSIGEGIYMCQHEVGDDLYMGWTICPDDGVLANSCQIDKRWAADIRWNTTVSAFSRRATVAYDRANISILSVERVSEPVQVKVDSTYSSLYMNLVLSPIDPTLNWTQNNDTYSYSANRFAFTYGLGFLLRLYTSNYSTFQDGGVYLLRSFIAVPFQFATSMRQYGGYNRMPPENTVTATLSRSSYRAIIESWTVWTFSWLSFVLIYYCIGFLVWMALWGPHTPNLSAFPEIDITSKSSLSLHAGLCSPIRSDMDPHLEMAEQTLEDLGRLTRSRGMGDGKSFQIAKRIRGRRVFCGSLPGQKGDEELIVLLTEEAGRLRCLSKGNKYY